MLGKLNGWDDTIVAMATPQGIGAIGVIRVSGGKAIEVINSMFHSKDISKEASHTLHVGLLKNGDEILDEVVLSLFKNPSSYTGEDVIEISCHGSPFIQEKIIQAITAKGCRLAKAGEFTQRAFLNGKLDLTQAEAVADLIASNTEASKNTAIKNIRGGFSNALKDLREELIKFSALIELELDFSQEDVEFADRKKFTDLIEKLISSTQELISSFQLGNVIKNGVQVAIIGKPNAGKSTLLNTLLNENRAIVSDIAGTTRDTIEEIINIDGILFRLFDTAGLREHAKPPRRFAPVPGGRLRQGVCHRGTAADQYLAGGALHDPGADCARLGGAGRGAAGGAGSGRRAKEVTAKGAKHAKAGAGQTTEFFRGSQETRNRAKAGCH